MTTIYNQKANEEINEVLDHLIACYGNEATMTAEYFNTTCKDTFGWYMGETEDDFLIFILKSSDKWYIKVQNYVSEVEEILLNGVYAKYGSSHCDSLYRAYIEEKIFG